MSYAREGFVDVRIARIFNTFGPRMHPEDGRVVSNFIKQSLMDEPLTVYGSGDNTRSFQYVSDLIRGLIALMASDYKQPVNIGNPEEFTVLQFAQKIKDKVRLLVRHSVTGSTSCHGVRAVGRLIRWGARSSTCHKRPTTLVAVARTSLSRNAS
jgi:nucleoside-diphosphate-sugar epimerase